MKKILLSIFFAVCMLLTNISIMAEEGANAGYKDAVELLSKLNIISISDTNSDFSTQSNVTRGEFCVYLVRAFKIETLDNQKQIFSDVPADSDLVQYVNALYECGVVSGYGGEFRPRDIITYNEAIKMLVLLLNYDHAEQLGGYPAGYLNIASSLELTKGVQASKTITKGTAAQLIYNAMSAPLMELVQIKGSEITFTSNSDKSVFTEYYDIYEGKGIVLANACAELTPHSYVLNDDEVLIDNIVFNAGSSDVDSLLGHYVEFLYLEVDDQVYEIVMLLKDNGEELIITSNSDIEFDGESYIYTAEGGKTKKVRLNKDFLVMYNFDFPQSGFESEMMEPTLGRIKLVKNGKGNDYTTVMIEEYVNYVVSTVDVNKEVIYTKDRVNIELGRKDFTILDENGKITDLSAINEWNVISVLESVDGKKVTIYVTDKEIAGKVTKSGNISNPIVGIDSAEYYVSPGMLSQLTLGKEGSFYLDYIGNIAGIRETDSDGRYAYMVRAVVDSDYGSNADERACIIIFDEDGIKKKYYLSEKVRINDVLYKNDPERTVNVGLNLSIKLLKYQLNDKGEINNIYVYDEYSDKYIRKLFDGKAVWNQKQRSFGGKVTMEKEALVFEVPEGYDVEDYQIVGLSAFENDKEATVSVYTMGDNVYGDVILRDSASGKGYKRPIAIVRKVKMAVDEAGDPCVILSVLYNGSEEEFTLAKEEYLGSVDEGDVIKISLDHLNQIQGILHIYDRSEDEFLLSNPYEPNSDAKYRSNDRMYYGYAYDVTDGLLRYCMSKPIGNEKPDTENALLSGFRIYIIDGTGSRTEIRTASEKEIRAYTSVDDCSRVIVQTMWGDPEDIVIIQ